MTSAEINEVMSKQDQIEFVKNNIDTIVKVIEDAEETLRAADESPHKDNEVIAKYSKHMRQATNLLLHNLKSNPELAELLFNVKYDVLPSNAIFTNAKRCSTFLHNGAKLPSMNRKLKYKNTIADGAVGVSIEYNGLDKHTLMFSKFSAMGTKSVVNFHKTFNYLLIKANEQNYPGIISFSLEDFQRKLGYANKDTAYSALVKYRDELMKIEISKIKEKGKKELLNARWQIFNGGTISRTDCTIFVNSELFRALNMYYTALPTWAYKLNSKAYSLLDFIYIQARQKSNQESIMKDKYFNISFSSISEYIGCPNPKDTKYHCKLIYEPILNAVEEIEKMRRKDELMLTPFYEDSATGKIDVHNFLRGYLKVEFNGEINHHIERMCQQREEKIKQGTEIRKLKAENKKLKTSKSK